MRFSDHFKIEKTPDDDWFDPVLSLDTQLFLDPFLLYAHESGFFVGSHAEVISFFNSMFKLVAESSGKKDSVRYKKALASLVFPEVQEICLGYTAAGTRGSGSGVEVANVIAGALEEAVKAGLEEIRHFEEIGILREGIGADRISDITAGLLRHRLAAYTTEVCQRHNLPTEKFAYRRGIYDVTDEAWKPIEVGLPRNPYNNYPILLVPRRYVRDLPTMNAEDFWDYCANNENETLRNELNYDIAKRVDKKEIIELARKRPDLVRKYEAATEQSGSQAYDFLADKQGYVRWYDATKDYCVGHPFAVHVASVEDFDNAVDLMAQQYRHFVEQNGGWELLWNETRTASRSEKAAQLLFLGLIKQYCMANDIDVSPEADIGRGPVDFKVSAGYSRRALLELKLARNTKFWSGLQEQLPTYMYAEGIAIGYFVVIVFNDKDADRLKEIQQTLAEVKKETGYDIRVMIVDARANPPSASRLTARPGRRQRSPRRRRRPLSWA